MKHPLCSNFGLRYVETQEIKPRTNNHQYSPAKSPSSGASKGIGAAIAKNLAEVGAAVVVNYASSKAGADAVVAEITTKGGKAVRDFGSRTPTRCRTWNNARANLFDLG